MIVYGDPQSLEPFDTLLERLRTCLRHAHESPPPLDDLRALLVRAGQLEQAVYDAQDSLDHDILESVHAVTQYLADAFCASCAGAADVRERLALALHIVQGVRPPHQPLTVKLPEGFAFYMLYPEQYLAAARRWLDDYAESSARSVCVIGIRSIGTTLAAVVASAIRNAYDWQVTTFSVRPTGHPYERTVELPVSTVDPNGWCIIVDEGPGLSGSSFVAAAEAAVRAGFRRNRICFFPGHSGMPGSAASATVRRWWETTPRYFTPLDQVRFGGPSLQEALAAESARLLGEDVVRVEDFGGGLWRRTVYPPDQMPSASIPFERPKYRVTLSNGEQVLWKFGGFAAAPESNLTTAGRDMQMMQARHESGDSPQPFGQLHGFVAQTWIEGEWLRRGEVTPELLHHIGGYIVRAAGEPLTQAEQQDALTRLREMLYWNAWELVGEAEAEKTHRWTLIDAPLQSYGDGRLNPHEWLRTTDGSIVKTDSAPHDLDHTIIGRQSILWDVAGAMVEWAATDEHKTLLKDGVQRALGVAISEAALSFYRAAYAAFRGGMCILCAQSISDQAEQNRLYQTANFYRQALIREIDR